jgi:iron uptake system component EfeO
MPGKWAARIALGAAVLLVGCGGGDDGPSAEASRQLRESLAKYETYLQKNADKLLHWTETIVLKVDEGSVPKAQSRYAASRIPYGRIDPVADLRRELEGYREIEEGIFGEESTAGLAPVAEQLRLDVEGLQQQIDSADLRPPQIVVGANEVLGEVLESELPGQSEPNSGTTLTTVAAQTEGVDAALKAVEPLLAEADPQLLARLQAQLRKVYEKVGEYGTFAKDPEQSRPQEPGIAFVVYSEFDPKTIREIAQPIEALAELVARAEEQIGA